MRKLITSSILLGCSVFTATFAQKSQYKVAVAAFYNCENFYDTVHNPLINDNEFLPTGEKKYGTAIYTDKVTKLATVISQIGTDINPAGIAFMGVAEVENVDVINDLVHHPLLAKRNYKIVHYDSRDARGIDVGFIYNPAYFTVIYSNPLFVQLPSDSKKAYYTRDILYVKGNLDGETIHILVNHWPSRLGGEEKSAPARAAAASVCKRIVDSLNKKDDHPKIVIMGDLNDDPVSPSVTKVLGAKDKLTNLSDGDIYNPWTDLYKKGIGTLAYQDSWGLFDQIMISSKWTDKSQKGFFYYQRNIFNKEFLVENLGHFKGYPMRTWDGNNYRGGYSDHFPVYISFLKKVD
ncbi:MAG: endonuclease/exonuclease/phosphatase [Sphingobacteriia bacterium]|nr:endonuclease/exonuclease/phosphatase [Sphingobacteriia bacterium]